MTTSIQRSALLSALMLLFVCGQTFAQDYAEPGTCDSVEGTEAECSGALGKASAIQALTPYVSFTGNIAVSVDGVGTQNFAGADIQVAKPSNAATVRAAFLMATTTSGARPMTNVTISRGAASLLVTPADYDQVVTSALGGLSGIKDITSFIKPNLDPVAGGTYTYHVVEATPILHDGEVLVVIFDEPSAPSSTYVLSFGAQTTAGDNFNVTLGSPFNDTDVDIQMALGISFGFQPAGQFSTVDVNGARLTSSAGGQDDCDIYTPPSNFCSQNGSLLTVGGLGDDPANPADPNVTDGGGARTDDELYTIDPFLDNGDTQIIIATRNPSSDDNMFFAGFLIRGTAAVIGEGILLTPPDDTNPTNTNHTVTAFVQDANGDPVVGRDVDFEITSGPNAGLMATVATDANGEAAFTWLSAVAGVDIVEASFVASNQQTLSTTARKTWVESGQCDVPRIVSETIDRTARTIELVYEDADGIAQISYRYPADFPDVSKAGQPALENLQVIDDGGLNSVNGIDFTASSPYPTTVTQVLQALGPGLVVYFPLITDACTDPEPQVYDADPSRLFDSQVLPSALKLDGNYPNPFNPSTTIHFTLPEASQVTVEVYDLVGRRVATLLDNTTLDAGSHEVRFDAVGLPSGSYLLRVEAADEVQMGRMTLIK